MQNHKTGIHMLPEQLVRKARSRASSQSMRQTQIPVTTKAGIVALKNGTGYKAMMDRVMLLAPLPALYQLSLQEFKGKGAVDFQCVICPSITVILDHFFQKHTIEV